MRPHTWSTTMALAPHRLAAVEAACTLMIIDGDIDPMEADFAVGLVSEMFDMSGDEAAQLLEDTTARLQGSDVEELLDHIIETIDDPSYQIRVIAMLNVLSDMAEGGEDDEWPFIDALIDGFGLTDEDLDEVDGMTDAYWDRIEAQA